MLLRLTCAKTICLWVIGIVAVNVASETLSRAYYGCFSESTMVPSSGWMAFDEGSTDITVHCVVPITVGGTVQVWVNKLLLHNRRNCC